MGVQRWVAMALHIQGQVVGFGTQQVAVEKRVAAMPAAAANCIEVVEVEGENGMVMVMGDKEC